MPLPPALAAKLAKRGIIKASNGPTAETGQESNDKVQEEIIAEDYDDTPQQAEVVVKKSQPDIIDKFQGWHACPNKWNVYHECSQGCRKQWKEIAEINSSYNKSRLKMLQKYPLPSHWLEILEQGLGKYYYWNTETDMVSWLPPAHPKCQVSRAAAMLRKQMLIDRESRLMEEGKDDDNQPKDDKDSDYEDSSDDDTIQLKKRKRSTGDSSESSDDSEEETREKRSRSKPEIRSREFEDQSRKGKKRGRKEVIDPMDPSSYSDCPRGTWSSGLSQQDEAQTGVDTTASGPLFQMRPYPNPGSILRANKNVGPSKPS